MNHRIGKLRLTDLSDGTVELTYGEPREMIGQWVEVGKDPETATTAAIVQAPPTLRLTKEDIEDLKVLLDLLGESPVVLHRSHAEAIIAGAQSLVRDVKRRTGARCSVDVSLDGSTFYETVAYCEEHFGSRFRGSRQAVEAGQDVEISRLYGGRRGY